MSDQGTGCGLLQALQTHPTPWDPSAVKVTLNVALDGCIVPSQSGGARVDYAHLVVLDNFLDEPTRQALLDAATEPGWQGRHPPAHSWERRTADAAQAAPTWGLKGPALAALAAGELAAKLEVQSRLCKLYPDMLIAHMPSEHIQVGAQQPAGAAAAHTAAAHTDSHHNHQQQQQQECEHRQQEQQQEEEQRHLQQEQIDPQEVQHQHQQQQETRQHGDPQQQSATQQQQQQQQAVQLHPPQQGASQQQGAPHQQQQQQRQHAPVDCSWLLVNAAVQGDVFSWHVDADPLEFPQPSPWSLQYGAYCNREGGKPLLVSLLIYLDKEWPLGHDAETLFLDTPTDTGVFVRPRAYRAVLMDQDVVHRLSSPSASAHRPRYSLVWKLAMLPRPQQVSRQEAGPPTWPSPCIARKEWGPPTYFGSAAHVLRVAKQTAAAAGHAVRHRRVPEGPAVAAAASVTGVSDNVSAGPGMSGLDTVQHSAKRQHV